MATMYNPGYSSGYGGDMSASYAGQTATDEEERRRRQAAQQQQSVLFNRPMVEVRAEPSEVNPQSREEAGGQSSTQARNTQQQQTFAQLQAAGQARPAPPPPQQQLQPQATTSERFMGPMVYSQAPQPGLDPLAAAMASQQAEFVGGPMVYSQAGGGTSVSQNPLLGGGSYNPNTGQQYGPTGQPRSGKSNVGVPAPGDMPIGGFDGDIGGYLAGQLNGITRGQAPDAFQASPDFLERLRQLNAGTLPGGDIAYDPAADRALTDRVNRLGGLNVNAPQYTPDPNVNSQIEQLLKGSQFTPGATPTFDVSQFTRGRPALPTQWPTSGRSGSEFVGGPMVPAMGGAPSGVSAQGVNPLTAAASAQGTPSSGQSAPQGTTPSTPAATPLQQAAAAARPGQSFQWSTDEWLPNTDVPQTRGQWEQVGKEAARLAASGDTDFGPRLIPINTPTGTRYLGFNYSPEMAADPENTALMEGYRAQSGVGLDSTAYMESILSQLPGWGKPGPAAATAEQAAPQQAAAQPVFMQQQAQPESELYGLTEQSIIDALRNPSAFDNAAVRELYDRLGQDIDDKYSQQQTAMREEMAARGLSDSSIMGGRLADLNVGQRQARSELATQLGIERARDFANARAQAIGMGQDQRRILFGEEMGREGLKLEREKLGVQKEDSAADRSLRSQLGMADIGVRQQQLAQQASQFAAENALNRDRFGLERQLGMGNLDLNRTRANQDYSLGLGNLDLGRTRAAQDYSLGAGNLNLQSDLGRGRLGLDAQTAAANTGLNRDRLALDAAGQRFDQGMRGLDFQNRVGQQGFQNQMSTAELQARLQDQNFRQGMGRAEFEANQNQRGFQNQITAADLGLRRSGQAFDQNMRGLDFENRVGQQGFQNRMSTAELNRLLGNDAFAQRMGITDRLTDYGQRAFDNDLRRADFNRQQQNDAWRRYLDSIVLGG